MTDWIDVKDKLPPIGRFVECYSEKHGKTHGWRREDGWQVAAWFNGNVGDIRYFPIVNDVTKWKAVPDVTKWKEERLF